MIVSQKLSIIKVCSDYVVAIYEIFAKIRNLANTNKECEDLIQINKFKELLLDIGISDKKFYEDCIREIIYNKKTKFYDFIRSFHNIFKLKFDQNFIKYKFLLYISPKKYDDFIDSEDLEKFYEMIGPRSVN